MSIDPNTGSLSPENFARIEEPLIRIDEFLQRFAERIGATVWRNYHGRPARDVVLESPEGITRRIEIASVLRDPTAKVQSAQAKMDYAVTIYVYRKATLSMGKMRAEHVATFREMPSASFQISELLKDCWGKIERISAREL
jgi:hypothetical protein